MDKLNQYRPIIRAVINEIAEMTPSDANSETQIVMDDERRHYVLFSIGWQDISRSS